MHDLAVNFGRDATLYIHILEELFSMTTSPILSHYISSSLCFDIVKATYLDVLDFFLVTGIWNANITVKF